MKSILSSIKNWLSVGNRSKWCLFLLFVLTLFVKTMIFHWSCFHSVLISSLWKHTPEFLRFWGGKISPILLISSFVFLSKRNWWTIITLLLSDIWMIANLFYYRANTLLLSLETMKMADNMSGFWSSLLSYIGWDMAILILTTFIYIALFVALGRQSTKRCYWFCISWMMFAISIMFLTNYFYGMSTKTWGPQNSATEQVNTRWLKGEEFTYYYPFGHVYYYSCVETCTDYNAWSHSYAKDYSIISYFPACFVYSWLAPAGELIQLTKEQEHYIEDLVLDGDVADDFVPKTNLIFILFESLESWPLTDVCGFSYLPNLQKLIHQEHVLYCDKLKSQVKHGNSADGQMIAATGMLPISNGATCRLYGKTDFPNYAHFFKHSAIFNPAPGMWQQSIVTYSYQFKNLYEPSNKERWGDKELLEEMTKYVLSEDSSFCILGITVESHVPFAIGSTKPIYEVDGMPAIMSAYVNCLHYTDEYIGGLLDAIMNSDLRNNTTIVISGDHTIFRSEDAEADAFANMHGINFQSAHTSTPLIVYSPTIEGNICVTDTCYQMDIFPTLLSLVGAEDYYWHGFGVNVMDSTARHNRPISENDAYHLSDLMIRSDYFRQYMNK